jgi:hypothetical protein
MPDDDWPDVRVLGVYRVEDAPEPCHLIEMLIYADGFSMSDITQELPDAPRAEWQAPWDERVLNDSGDQVVAHAWDLPEPGYIEADKTRLTFFFHYLDLARPLSTPWGALELPAPTAKPDRLASVEYEEP